MYAYTPHMNNETAVSVAPKERYHSDAIYVMYALFCAMALCFCVVLSVRAYIYSSLWFQYAGHGNYSTDYSGDEVDKKDECIATSDKKYISDDEFRKLFTSQINKNAKMFCLMDCCHSGTIMDLKYKYQSNKTNWTTENKYAVDANVIAISGCRDDQTSADAWLNSNWCGAMTTSFLNAMATTNYKPNMFTLLDKMRVFLRSNGFTQIPQLTSTQIIRENQVFSA